MDAFKNFFNKTLGGETMSIRVKIFWILFAFLIAQASFQLYQNVKQSKNALVEMTDSLEENLKDYTDIQGGRLSQISDSRKDAILHIRNLIITSVTHMMLTGNADIVEGWIEGLREDKMFLSLQVYRGYNKPGQEAFRDNRTINRVNSNLGAKRFSKRRSRGIKTFPKDQRKAFDIVLNSGEDQFYEEQINGTGAFTGLFAIKNLEDCQICHGENHTTRGVLKVSISSEEAVKAGTEIKGQIGNEKDKQEARLTDLRQQSSFTRNLAIVAAIVLITINLMVLNTFFNFTVVKPVNQISNIAGRIAEGDLTEEIDVSRKDEIGELSAALATMQGNLKEMIFKINKSSSDVTNSASDLGTLAGHIAQGTEKQTDQASHVATSVEEMSTTIMQIARNSSEALESSNLARETATSGAKVVKETVAGIHRISKAMEKSSSVIDELGANSDQISRIVSVIDDIADQTNLLALNAAIEAARAGEAGRGFAVVADEVRKLAERTTKATKEIANMIGKIQADTADAITSMSDVKEEVEKGVDLADETGRSLNQIVGQVQNSADMVGHIATASEQQSKAVEEISKNVNEVAEVSRETSKDTQETSQAAQKLMQAAADLKKLVEMFKV